MVTILHLNKRCWGKLKDLSIDQLWLKSVRLRLLEYGLLGKYFVDRVDDNLLKPIPP